MNAWQNRITCTRPEIARTHGVFPQAPETMPWFVYHGPPELLDLDLTIQHENSRPQTAKVVPCFVKKLSRGNTVSLWLYQVPSAQGRSIGQLQQEQHERPPEKANRKQGSQTQCKESGCQCAREIHCWMCIMNLTARHMSLLSSPNQGFGLDPQFWMFIPNT